MYVRLKVSLKEEKVMNKGILLALLVACFATVSAKAFFVEDIEAKDQQQGTPTSAMGASPKVKSCIGLPWEC